MQRLTSSMMAAVLWLFSSYQQAICEPAGKIETIKIVSHRGGAWSGVPRSLTEETLVIWRKSDGDEVRIPVNTLTPDSLERTRAYLRKVAEEERLEKVERQKLDATRKGLNAYTLKCQYGEVTLYSSIEGCKVELDENRFGGHLIAPDESFFRFRRFDPRLGANTMLDLHMYMTYRDDIRDDFANKTEEEQKELRRLFNNPELVRHAGLEGWESKNEPPGTRCFHLLVDGQGYVFEHGSNAKGELREQPGKWDINFAEWERILKTIKIEYSAH